MSAQYRIKDTAFFLWFKREYSRRPIEEGAAYLYKCARDGRSDTNMVWDYLIGSGERAYTADTFIRIAQRILRGEGPAKTDKAQQYQGDA